MARDESITGAVASRSLPMVALSVVIAFLVVPVSESPYAWIALHSLVAFLAIIATATAIIRNLHSSSLGNWLFSAGLFFIVFRHLAAAIEDFIVVYGAGILEVGEEVLAIPLESVTIGLLFLASEIAYRRPTRLSNRTYAIICAGAVVISFYAYLVLYSWVFFQLDIGTALTITEGVGIIAIGVFLASGLLALHDKQTRTRVEVARHLTIYLLLGVVCIALLLSLLYPSSLWTTAPCLQVIVLFQIIVTVVLPIVSGMQLRLRSAYTFIFIVAVIALLPFVFVLIGEALLPGVRFYSIEVFLLAHIGAAILSGGMAILLYAYSKRQLSQVHFPLIFLFASWTTVEIGLIVTTLVRLPITLNQTLVPYVTGGFASLFLLMWIIRRLRQPREATKPQRLLLKSCLGIAAIVGIIWVGEIMQLSLHSVTTAVVGNPLDRIILMSFNLVLMFLFTFTAFLMLERFRSRITVETLALGFLTLWILPSLIRSITRQWTVGWWVGEFLLLAGLLFGPVILGIAYLDVLGRADDLRRQASLYADLLIHDIGNFHQIIQSSIDITKFPIHTLLRRIYVIAS
ncbi:MAG: hypothetical protein ACFFCO_06565, partial [Promethearchaeota archaeon]